MKHGSSSRVINPPDGGYGWVVVFSGFLSSFLVFGIGYSIGVIFDLLLVDFECSTAELTTFASIAYCLQCFLAPVASYVYHRVGARFTVIAGSFLFGIAMVSTAFATSIAALHFTFGVLAGIGMSLVYLPTRAMIPVYFQKRRTLANALCSMGGYLGAFAFPILIRFLTTVYSWRGAIFIMGAIQLNTVPAALLLLPLEEMLPNINTAVDTITLDDGSCKTAQLDGSIAEDGASGTDGGAAGGAEGNQSIINRGIEQTKARFAHPSNNEQSRAKNCRSTLDPPSAPSNSCALHPSFASDRYGYMSSWDGLGGSVAVLYSAPKPGGSLKTASHPGFIGNGGDLNDNQNESSESKVLKAPPKWSSRIIGFFGNYFRHFRNPKFASFFFGNFFKGFIFNTPTLFIVNYGLSIGLRVEQTTMLMAMLGFGNFAGRPPAAFFGDLFSGRRCLLFALSFGFSGAFTLLVPWITNFVFLTFFVIQFAVLTGAADVLVAPIAADLVPLHELGFALGVIISAAGLGYAIGPLSLALLPTYNVIFTVVGAIMLFNAGIVLLPDCCNFILRLTTPKSSNRAVMP